MEHYYNEGMEIRFTTSDKENLFFFISNLSNWHFSCRPDYNIEWLKESGELKSKEKIALADFKKIITKYGFYKKNGRLQYLGQYFFVPKEKDKWSKVKKFVTVKEYKQLRKTFLLFKPRFKKIWHKEKVRIWQNSLQEQLKLKSVKNLLSDIKRFIRPRENINSINVHLLLSPSKTRTAAGGANLGNKDITLEVPIHQFTKWSLEYALAILIHEITHIFFDNSNAIKLTKSTLRNNRKLKVIKTDRTPEELLKEIIIGTCSPYGYFCDKYLRNYEPIPDILLPSFKKKTKNTDQLIKQIVWQLYPLTAYYDANKKYIDKEFIKRVISFLK